MRFWKSTVLIAAVLISSSLITPQAQAHKSSNEITINIVGDVHGESAIKRGALSSLKRYFVDGNLNIFNLETAVTDKNQREEKQYNFKTQPDFLASLKSIGFNVATIANNHSYDYGNEGFLDTIRNLDKSGIAYVGGGLNSGIAYKGRVFTVKGLRIGILGFAKVNGGPASIAAKNRPGTTNGYDVAATTNAIDAMKKIAMSSSF